MRPLPTSAPMRASARASVRAESAKSRECCRERSVARPTSVHCRRRDSRRRFGDLASVADAMQPAEEGLFRLEIVRPAPGSNDPPGTKS